MKNFGTRLLRGTGRVVRPGVVEVDGTQVEYRDLVLNTGSVPAMPQVPGLDTVPTWTTEQAMSASEQPRSMVSLRDLRDRMAELSRTRRASSRVVRHSLLWRTMRKPVVREGENAGHLDLLDGSCLMLTRTALTMSPPIAGGLPRASPTRRPSPNALPLGPSAPTPMMSGPVPSQWPVSASTHPRHRTAALTVPAFAWLGQPAGA